MHHDLLLLVSRCLRKDDEQDPVPARILFLVASSCAASQEFGRNLMTGLLSTYLPGCTRYQSHDVVVDSRLLALLVAFEEENM